MLDAVFRLGARRPIDDQGLHPAAGPTPDPDLPEVADMVGVQMRGKNGRNVLMRNFESGEIHLRARSEVHDELVTIAELDKPGAVGLRPAHEWPAGAECNDAHLVGGERLRVWKIMVASSAHGQ